MKRYPDFFLMIVLFAAACLLSFKSAKKSDSQLSHRNYKTINLPHSIFQSGDIIFRDGRGFISSIFKKLSLQDPQFSHAGIIHRENGKTYVYHMLGGENGMHNLMRKELLDSFCSYSQSNSIAVYRTDLSNYSIDSLAGIFYSKHILFDDAFDLTTEDKMYCTEMVWKILESVSGKNNFLPLTEFSGIKYVSCDNIYLSPHCSKIFFCEYSNDVIDKKNLRKTQ